MKLREVIGINLKYYRYKENKTQEQYYENAGLNFKYLSRIENGKINVTVDFIDDIAKVLKVEAKDLITYNENHIIDKKRIDEKEKKS